MMPYGHSETRDATWTEGCHTNVHVMQINALTWFVISFHKLFVIVVFWPHRTYRSALLQLPGHAKLYTAPGNLFVALLWFPYHMGLISMCIFVCIYTRNCLPSGHWTFFFFYFSKNSCFWKVWLRWKRCIKCFSF